METTKCMGCIKGHTSCPKTGPELIDCNNKPGEIKGCNFLSDVDDEYLLPLEQRTLCNCCDECRYKCSLAV